MYRAIITTLVFLLFAQWALAQRFSLSGTLQDQNEKPLGFATIMLLQAKDSSLVTFSRSNDQGKFEMRNVAPGSYLLKITYVGYLPFTREISQGQSGPVDLGVLVLEEDIKELSEVTIEGERSPVTINKDTIEFNAAAFQPLAPNATVEELLKRLPGVEVESDGTIKAQGETVQRVTVNGKEFFGRDPKLATRNLPSVAVDKVQVYDRRSDQATFSGIDDGQREKTINLELKEEYRNGSFGNFQAGAGVDQTGEARYETRLSFNRFSKTTQLSVLGMGNNVNQQGFSVGDYLNFSGELSRGMGGGGGGIRIIRGGGQGGGANAPGGVPLDFGGRNNGIMTNWAGGANINHRFNKKTEINGSYFLNHLDHFVAQDVRQENFLPNGTFTSVQNSRQNNQNLGHRLNMTLDHHIDSANTLRLTMNVAKSETEVGAFTTSRTLGLNNQLQNTGENLNRSVGNNLTLNTNLLYRHRFAKKGRTLSATLSVDLNDNNSTGDLDATNRFFSPEGGTLTERILQEREQTAQTATYGMNLTYTEPLGKRQYLELSYQVRNTDNQVDQKVFDLQDNNREVNTNLTNIFDNNFLFQRVGANLRYIKGKYNITAGAAYQSSVLNGELPLQDFSLRKPFSNVLPNARVNIQFSNAKRLNFDYDTDLNAPSIRQLQPVIDNSDPLNVYVGNPELRPEFTHRFRVNFLTFDPITFVNFFGLVNMTITDQKIINAQFIDENFVRVTSPVNTRGFMNLSGNFNLGFRVKALNTRFGIGPRTSYTRSINRINENDVLAQQYTYGGGIRADYRFKEVFDFGIRADLSRQETIYAFSEQQNQYFLNQTYASEANLKLPKGFQFGSNFEYLIFSSQTTGFRQDLPLLNVSFSKFFLKNQSGELKLAMVNVLDQNLGVTQQADVNFLQQTIVNNLGRYTMLTFVYTLNKALNPTGGMGGGRRGGGGGMMFRMMN